MCEEVGAVHQQLTHSKAATNTAVLGFSWSFFPVCPIPQTNYAKSQRKYSKTHPDVKRAPAFICAENEAALKRVRV